MIQLDKNLIEKLSLQDGYGQAFTVSLEIVLYTTQPRSISGSGAVECFDRFYRDYGTSLGWYCAGNMRKSRRFSAKAIEKLQTLCSEPDGKHEAVLPDFHAAVGKDLMDIAPPAFMMGGYNGHSYVQVHLPLQPGMTWEALHELLAELTAVFPFKAGHVGLSICCEYFSADRDQMNRRPVGVLLKRYLGLNLGEPAMFCKEGLPPVNWLTLLGPEALDRLGGMEAVVAALSDDEISVMPMGAGVCIRAGELPQLGDRNRQDDLPVYRKVGRYLKDLRLQLRPFLPGMNQDESEVWLARFDK